MFYSVIIITLNIRSEVTIFCLLEFTVQCTTANFLYSIQGKFLWFVSSEAERCTSKEIFYECLELKHYRKRSAKDLLIEYHAVFLKYVSEEAESRIDCNVHENKFDESDPEE